MPPLKSFQFISILYFTKSVNNTIFKTQTTNRANQMQTITSISKLRASMLTNGLVKFETRGVVTTGNTNGFRGKVFRGKDIIIRKNLDGSYLFAIKERETGAIAKISTFTTIAALKDHWNR
ncbi:MAG: hypothetical protein Unbinned6354contig1000_33 [Prokaryotic dsDNA virus sp.]|nr:MAG: hypothetical protein Unbinned6354contig1000_33 [Prokaryotic dsDNA virus sp.]